MIFQKSTSPQLRGALTASPRSTPPLFFKPTALSLLCAAITVAHPAAAQDFTNADLDGQHVLFNVQDSDTKYSNANIDLEIEANARQSFFVMTVTGAQNGAHDDVLTLKDVRVSLTSTGIDHSHDEGTYVLKADKYGHVDILGNIDIAVVHGEEVNRSDIGANGIWANDHAVVNLGSEGTTTRIWTISDKPDSISAKLGSTVKINSTHNQIVGSMDMLSGSKGDKSTIEGTFSGADSYWFGDEFSRRNASKVLMTAIDWGVKDPADGELKLTFENGAQWSYLGLVANNEASQNQDATVKKRVSSLTLRNGGIVNLYDENLKALWKEIRNENLDLSLYDALNINGNFDFTHDYVRIGELNGSGGIFRIDVNGAEKNKSDLIFIEGAASGQGGTHHIQIEGLDTLDTITSTNTLIFAMVSRAATNAGVSFHEVENVEGDKLFNYELDIRPVEFSGDSYDEIRNREEFAGRSDILSFLADYFGNSFIFSPDAGGEAFKDGGTFWEIYRVVRSNSASTLGMIGSGYAGYDLAVEMDRRDRRIHEAVLENGADKGLWVRMNHGQMGASGVYKNNVDTVTIGFEGAPSASSRFGGWFSYATGDVDYSNVKGSADLTRYEAALYGTLLSGNHYLDLVGRFGRVKNEFDVSSNSGAIRTTGDYDQDYAALSAEYGYTLRDASTGVFLEPQLQIQVAYLRDFDYSTERGMRVHADAETSVIGRAGFRFGRQFRTAASVGEAHLRGDVLHQWTDGQQAVLKADADRISTVWGDKDTWADFGVGTFWNWKDRFSLQLDLERTVGGETVDTWQMSGRASLLF